ncbi:MAG: AAA family ATPase, partial [Bacteroidota bacterium]
ENFSQSISLKGTFNHKSVALQIDKKQQEGNFDKLHYLSTIDIHSIIAEQSYNSQLNLFDNREPELFTLEDIILCPASFTSPYRYNSELMTRAYEKAITDKYLEEVIEFIREKMDSDIVGIDLVPNDRFLVNSQAFPQAVDITKYGEGLQRVFEIAMLMGYSRNGIICIDELDSAIHKSLLIDFTQFIQEAARKFNVQVFLSTHSKECIDAFVENDYHNEDITAYALTEENGTIQCRYLPGTDLEELVEAINIDIR